VAHTKKGQMMRDDWRVLGAIAGFGFGLPLLVAGALLGGSLLGLRWAMTDWAFAWQFTASILAVIAGLAMLLAAGRSCYRGFRPSGQWGQRNRRGPK
jgi:hypothetical protein